MVQNAFRSLLFLFAFQLFDFDIEVKPIVEVLVGKTMEQALLEVMEEEELASLRERQVGEHCEEDLSAKAL